MSLDYDLSYNVHALECPWCEKTSVVDYEDFLEGNGNTDTTECGSCSKPLYTQINYEFEIRKVESDDDKA